jgi:hypothetical protein
VKGSSVLSANIVFRIGVEGLFAALATEEVAFTLTVAVMFDEVGINNLTANYINDKGSFLHGILLS